MITCKFVDKIFSSEKKETDNGYRVFKYECIKSDNTLSIREGDLFTACGYYLGEFQSAVYTLNGEWKEHDKYGLQLIVSHMEENIENTKAGIMAFLNSKQLKGIGKVTADRIYAKYGDKTLYILDNEIEKIREIPGVSFKNYEKFKASYCGIRGARDLIAFLAPYDISSQISGKVFEKYKENALDKIKSNPYVLTKIHGVTFQKSDKIASMLKLNPESLDRIQACILYVLSQVELSGNTGALKVKVFQDVKKTLYNITVTQEMFLKAIEVLVKEKELIVARNALYRTAIYTAENIVAKNTMRLSSLMTDTINNIEKGMKEWEAENFELDETQRDAIRKSLTNGFLVITGGPGTGKTTIINVVIYIIEKYSKRKSILLLSPTGRAAKRMEETTGNVAFTINSRLQVFDTTNNEWESENPIEESCVIVDEVSMLDIYLASQLLKSIESGSRVVFVGDVDQLPSVGPGAVLRDMIESEVIPVSRLQVIHRQKEDSKIIGNAQKINNGDTSLEFDASFQLCEANNHEDCAKKMVYIYDMLLKEYGKERITCITPHHYKTTSSVEVLNKNLQNKVNPYSMPNKEIHYNGVIFREGDILMQTKNNENATNGEIGIVHSVNKGLKQLEVTFSKNIIEYEKDDFDILEHAFAITVHKSQGSEYDCVILALLPEHRHMLVRNLFYTAVTRAKKRVIIVGNVSAINTAIMHEEVCKRHTLLKEKLQLCNKQFLEHNPFKTA